MDTKEVFEYLTRRIHSVVAATADEDGLPVTCVVDIMDADDDGLYFITARGKGFYNRLQRSVYLALSGMSGRDTLSRTAVSVRGKVRQLGSGLLPRLLQRNPYMLQIYPTEQSRRALTVFQLYQGQGEWFDLSRSPIERFSFTFGGATTPNEGYIITKSCSGCRICASVCPQGCIDFSSLPARIMQQHCLHCGNCMQVCPHGAVVRRGI